MTRKPKLGMQIWPAKEDFGRDMVGTVKAIAKMGYDGIELCRWYGGPTDDFDKWDAQDIRSACDDAGIEIMSSHIPYAQILGDKLNKVVEFAQVVGMKYVVVAALPKDMVTTRESVLKAADQFNKAAERLKAEGMRIGYHNHPHDFQPIDGEMPWDIFFSNTVPEVIQQLDIGNALNSGVDPIPYLERYPGRSTLVHLKEITADGQWAVIGEGVVDWERVFDLAERLHDPEWYIVEQSCKGYTPLECAEACLKNLRAMGK